MSEKIKRKITVIKEDVPFVKLTYCDECGRLIRQRVCTGFSNLRRIDHENRVEWYQVTTGHRDFGTDESDYRQETDICPDCIKHIFDKYLIRSRGENTQLISIDHCWTYNEEPMEEKTNE